MKYTNPPNEVPSQMDLGNQRSRGGVRPAKWKSMKPWGGHRSGVAPSSSAALRGLAAALVAVVGCSSTGGSSNATPDGRKPVASSPPSSRLHIPVDEPRRAQDLDHVEEGHLPDPRVTPNPVPKRLLSMDGELVVTWSTAAHEDFTSFCDRHYGRVASALLLYVGDEDLARDCTQEAFARACRDWGKVRDLESPEAWIQRVAINVANSIFRRWKIERRHRDVLSISAAPADEGIIAAITIRAALSRLPRRRRAALIMRHYSSMSIGEIADVLDCSPDGAKKLIQRAKATLKAELSADLLPEEE
jgi:RNA polymerase sigma factor (sigma-70 family)